MRYLPLSKIFNIVCAKKVFRDIDGTTLLSDNSTKTSYLVLGSIFSLTLSTLNLNKKLENNNNSNRYNENTILKNYINYLFRFWSSKIFNKYPYKQGSKQN